MSIEEPIELEDSIQLEDSIELESKENEFWDHATKYAHSGNDDEAFVSEIAYMMVTLHKTGS